MFIETYWKKNEGSDKGRIRMVGQKAFVTIQRSMTIYTMTRLGFKLHRGSCTL